MVGLKYLSVYNQIRFGEYQSLIQQKTQELEIEYPYLYNITYEERREIAKYIFKKEDELPVDLPDRIIEGIFFFNEVFGYQEHLKISGLTARPYRQKQFILAEVAAWAKRRFNVELRPSYIVDFLELVRYRKARKEA